ncbi:MAG: phosphoenolpyruvate--protein phosphotransferase [Rhodospirillales bacterium]|nr:phosphoenolpyruvate--protein phosphotransferase [Rhodospirillales bacterium]
MNESRPMFAFRQLLAKVRDVMAGEGDGPSRLARIVVVIAAELDAQVCSIYVRRAGEVLELFATEGLKREAVHVTRLRFGEGLIGKVAATGRPMALADAQKHPSFVYRPETGEEIYHSFLGVPILGYARVIGVLAVQSVDRRTYREDEVEALQTVAMVLGQVVLGGDLVNRQELAPAEDIATMPRRLEGLGLNDGIGIGIAVHHRPWQTIRRFVGDDPQVEHGRLQSAVAEMRVSLDDLVGAAGADAHDDYRDVLESYRMIAADAGWLRRIGDAIDTGLTAEAAVQKTTNEIRARLRQASDPYLSERVHDFEDLASRLLQHLLGGPAAGTMPAPDQGIVLVARNIGPTELLNYQGSREGSREDNRQGIRQGNRLCGLILEEGSMTAHAIIVARALDVPVIGHVRDALARIDPGDPVIVDADRAQVFVHPRDDISAAFIAGQAARMQRQAAYAKARDLPAVTRDGVRIGVHMNAGLLVDLEHLEAYGADGVGLYRTEIPFLVRSEMPVRDVQEQLYRRVMEQVGDKPVIFRTLDVGGDKVLSSWQHGDEENPAMGWRAIRVGLDRPALLRHQLSAMIRAAAGRDLAVMFPMLAHVEEFNAARRLLDKEWRAEAERGGTLPRSVRVGAMVEVPSLLFQLPALLSVADFVSVGTNDLLQFLFACDRGSPQMSERYDPLCPIVLNVLADLVEKCSAASVPITVCGEMSVRPVDAMALIGIGFRALSVPPRGIGPIKMMIRNLNLAGVEDYVRTLRTSNELSVRASLAAFARDHGVII